jgi:hypothetical protein
MAGGVLRGVVGVLRLPRGDRARAVEAAAQLTRASVELRLMPSSRTVRLLGPLHGGGPEVPVAVDRGREAARVGRAVAAAAARLPWLPTCLPQALAAQRMLRRRDIPAQLHLGVTSVADPSAHAWVTVDGKPVVGGRGVERYVPLAAFG